MYRTPAERERRDETGSVAFRKLPFYKPPTTRIEATFPLEIEFPFDLSPVDGNPAPVPIPFFKNLKDTRVYFEYAINM